MALRCTLRGRSDETGDGLRVHVSTPAIETVGLTKLYADTRALDELDLQVQQGEVFGYLGWRGFAASAFLNVHLEDADFERHVDRRHPPAA